MSITDYLENKISAAKQSIEPWFHWHWQNLQDRQQDRERGRTTKTFPLHGRAWFHVGPVGLAPEWSLLSPSITPGLKIKVLTGDGHAIQVHGAVPWLASVFLTLEFPYRWFRQWFDQFPDHFDVVSFWWFESTFWWDIWHDADSWSSRDPRWRSSSVCPADVLLGRHEYQSKVLSVHDAVIPMPEGPYPAVATLTEDSWTRSRFSWPAKVLRRATVEMKIPIPHQGKGENSWDCGVDATHSLTCPAENIEDAVGQMVQAVLKWRRQYDGNAMAQYPDPRTLPVKSSEPTEPHGIDPQCQANPEKI